MSYSVVPVPYVPALLANLGRPPRVLIVGESIMNDSYVGSRIASAIPGAGTERRTYGSSHTAVGMVALATDLQVWTTPGNLLANTSPLAWTNHNHCSSFANTSPSTGRANQQMTTDGTSGAFISGTVANGAVTVPAGAPLLTYSIDVEPGSLKSFRLMLYNLTTSGIVLQQDFNTAAADDHAGVINRACITVTNATGVGYAAGNVLSAYIYPGSTEGFVAGTLYVSNIQVNADGIASIPVPTSGTAQAVGAAGWQQASVATPRDLFDLVVIQFGVNDANQSIGKTDFEYALSSLISAAASFGGRVLVTTPPPKCVAGLTAWDPATDNYQNLGHYQGAKRAALRHGCFWYDAVADFQALVATGVYTVAQLMRDIYHPTYNSPTAIGIGRYVNAIVGVLQNLNDRDPHNLTPGPCVRIGGNPTAGTWSWTGYAISTIPAYDPYTLALGNQTSSKGQALQATAAATLSYSVVGRQVGVLFLADQGTVGTATITVDGVYVVTLNLAVSGLTLYPLCQWTHLGLNYGTHAVTVAWASGTVRVMGVVAC